MKGILKISLMVFGLYSCSEGIGTVTLTTLTNKSGHNIELQEFRNGKFQKMTKINNNNEIILSNSIDRGNGNTPILQPFNADSIWIIYYEKASIWHTTNVNSPVSRSLMLESSYEGGKVRDGLYEFTYTFTPEDYEEALEFGD